MRVLSAILAVLFLAACSGAGMEHVVLKNIPCIPKPVEFQCAAFPEYEGKKFSRAGVRVLVSNAKVAWQCQKERADIYDDLVQKCVELADE